MIMRLIIKISSYLGAAVLLGAVAWQLRAPGVEGLDGANFLHALQRYDLAAHMPHFPGYPVYIALARVAAQLLPDPVSALQLPGVVAWAAALPLLWLAARQRLGPSAAWAATTVSAFAPLSLLTAGQASSDALGTALLAAAGSLVALGTRAGAEPARAPRLALLGVGLSAVALGVRASLFPAVGAIVLAALVLQPGRRRATLGAFAAGMLLWAVPFAWAVGPDLPALAGSFLEGHFLTWGGTALVTGDPTGRAADWLGLFATYVLALPAAGGSPLRWIAGPAVVALLALGVARSGPRDRVVGLALLAPYVLWLLVGQNPEKPRHLLPVVPVVAVLVGIGYASLGTRARLAGALAGGALAAVTLSLGMQQAAQPSPAVQMAQWLPDHYPQEGTQLFLGPSERVLGVMEPGYRAEYAPDLDEVHRRISTFRHRSPVLLVSDEIPGAAGEPVAVFSRNPLVDPHRPRITLYEVHQ